MEQGPRPSTWPGDSDSRGSGVRRPPGSSSGDSRAGPAPGRAALPRLPGFPYEVVRQLGVGGMGAVYEVAKPGDPRRLAAKLLTLQSAHARARFEREGQLVARLEHPGVIPVLASGVTDSGVPYLIFEYVDGRSLKDVLQEASAPLDEPTVVRWGEQLAAALGSAHALGIVHRDVKPANIMIDGSGQVRVADFGIALAADLDRLTKTGQLAGTPLYMAPEQFSPDLPVGPWTDVHAVGSVLFEALAGHAPYEAPTAANVVASILHGEPPSLRAARRDVSDGLAAVIARCLEKDPTRRYPDGRALAEDLTRLRRGERVSAVSMFLRAARRRVMRRTTVVALGLVVFVGLPAAGLVALRRARAGAERDQAAAKLAGDLDALAAQVRPDASERALALAERDLQRARTLVPELGEGPARVRLLASIEALGARCAVAVATERAKAAMRAGALEPGALTAALEALERVPPVTPGAGDVDGRAREEARAWLLYLAGRLEPARGAAARLAPEAADGAQPGPSPDLDAWLADPAHRARWLAAWCALRLGDAAGARRLAGTFPAGLRARLAAAEAAVAEDPEGARAAVATLPGGRANDAAAALLAASLDVDALLRGAAPVDLGRALEVLDEVRRLSLPGSPSRVPRAVQAQASLLEGEVHLGIGWPASAAAAFARATRLMTDAGAPFGWPAAPLALPVGGGRRRVLLAPDTAARVGEALARALSAAPAATTVTLIATATARAAVDHPPLAAARLAAAAALVTGDAPPDDDATTPAALQVAGAWPPLAEDLAASGEADLGVVSVRARRRAAAAQEGAALTAEVDPAAAQASAVQALRLATRLGAGQGGPAPTRALAGLARAEAAVGDVAAADAALALAQARDAAAPTTLVAAAHVALAHGRPEAAVEAGLAAAAALEAEERRLIERAELTTALLLPLIDALERAGHQVDALPLLDLASRCADRDRLAVEARAALHRRLERAARALRREDLARQALERQARLEALADRLNRAVRLIAAQTRTAGQLADTPELRQAFALVMQENPQDASTYISNHVFFGRLRGEGFDNLALAFECHADTVLDYLNDPSFSLRRMAPSEAGAAAASILLLTDEVSADPTLPVPRDEDLRRALAGLYCAELRIPLEPRRLASCLRAARAAWGRRPMSEPASLVLGRLLVEAGAAADALPLLRRTQDQMALTPLGVVNHGSWRPLYEALAWAALRDLERARVALAEARDRHLSLSHRIREEPLFWEDRSLSGTIFPWAAEVAKEIEARFGAR